MITRSHCDKLGKYLHMTLVEFFRFWHCECSLRDLGTVITDRSVLSCSSWWWLWEKKEVCRDPSWRLQVLGSEMTRHECSLFFSRFLIFFLLGGSSTWGCVQCRSVFPYTVKRKVESGGIKWSSSR
jgi:hypothetical protein